MKSSNIKKIRKSMEKALDSKRYEHTLGVAYTACALAMRYDADMEKAQIAGLLHDCAKCLSDDKKISICKKNNVEITPIEQRNPYLLHAKAGCCIARNKFLIKDQEILNAILNHTTGRPEMTDLEKIIYIADYIEPGRKQAPNLSEVRKLAFLDLNQTLLKILSDSLEYLESTGGEIDPMTRKTFEYFTSQK